MKVESVSISHKILLSNGMKLKLEPEIDFTNQKLSALPMSVNLTDYLDNPLDVDIKSVTTTVFIGKKSFTATIAPSQATKMKDGQLYVATMIYAYDSDDPLSKGLIEGLDEALEDEMQTELHNQYRDLLIALGEEE